jgi:hypothetical protein
MLLNTGKGVPLQVATPRVAAMQAPQLFRGVSAEVGVAVSPTARESTTGASQLASHSAGEGKRAKMKSKSLLVVVIQLSLMHYAHASPPTVPDEAKLLELTGKFYPAIVHDKRSSPELVLGFLLDSEGGVVRNTAGFSPRVGQSIEPTLEAMFPGFNVARMSRGALCVPDEARRASKFCVYWLQLRTGQSVSEAGP